MKFCKDCRHAWPPDKADEWLCGHPTAGIYRYTDVVTGERRADPIPCRVNRRIGNCTDAQHWEPKDAPGIGFVDDEEM